MTTYGTLNGFSEYTNAPVGYTECTWAGIFVSYVSKMFLWNGSVKS
jgi:hypothetical protein